MARLLSFSLMGVALSVTTNALGAPDALGPQLRNASILYIVDSTGDGGQVGSSSICNDGTGACTLRAAIQASNAHAGDDDIEFSLPAASVIMVGSALPSVTGNVRITGPGPLKLRVVRNDAFYVVPFRIFDVTATGTVTISGMQISGGRSAGTGGGIQNSGGGTLNIVECFVSSNYAGGNGGAITNFGTGTVNVVGTLLYANNAASGAGIFNQSTGTINVVNTVVYNGFASGNGGGIHNNVGGAINVTNSTVAFNAAQQGGGLYNNGAGVVRVKSTIVGRNSGNLAPDIAGTFVSAGFNLVGKKDGGSGFVAATDQTGTIAAPLEPQLSDLQPVNGVTWSVRPACGSPAVDRGSSAGLTGMLANDQRGNAFLRTYNDPAVTNATGGDGTDIGAFERQEACNKQLAFTVNTTSDVGDANPGDEICDVDSGTAGQQCTLRAALEEAALKQNNDAVIAITIGFAIPLSDPGYDASTGRHTINLTKELPPILTLLNLNGPGRNALTVRRSAGGDYPVFRASSNAQPLSVVSITGMTISNGSGATGGGIQSSLVLLTVSRCSISGNAATGNGGGLYADRGTLTVNDCTINGNVAGAQGNGGGIYSTATSAMVTDVAVTNNSAAKGGGIYAEHDNTFSPAVMSIVNSTISGNTSSSACGGICVATPMAGGSLTVGVTSSTVSENTSQFGPGGGFANGGKLNITNSTIARNAGTSAGGIHNTGELALSNSTLVGNFSNSSGMHSTGTATIKSNIIAGHRARDGAPCACPDATGAYTSAGFNLLGAADAQTTGFSNGVNNDQVGTIVSPVNPKLDPAGLKSNGGPTQTISLQPGSPAIDGGTSSGLMGALAADQRGAGFTRTFNNASVGNATGGDGTDIGAFEVQAVLVLATLNIDGSMQTKYDPLTDGLLVLRYLFGLTGQALVATAVGNTATRDTAAIMTYLNDIRPSLDVDGNGNADALTDGLLIVRYLFGLGGQALIQGAIAPLSPRTTAQQIADYLATLTP